VNHAYQWKYKAEFTEALAAAMDRNAGIAKDKSGKPKARPEPLPTDEGGYGYAFNAKPSPECPECRGEGKAETFFHDTRNLKGKAKKLFAGVKQTKDGLVILTRDQDAALDRIVKMLGGYSSELRLTGPGGGPLLAAALPPDATEAARVYQALMKTTPTK